MSDLNLIDHTIRRKSVLFRQFIYISFLFLDLVVIIPLFWLVFLYENFNPFNIDNLFSGLESSPLFLTLFIPGLFIFFYGILHNHKTLIPKANKIEEPFLRIRIHLECLSIGFFLPWIFSSAIEFFMDQYYSANSFYWFLILINYVFSFSYLLYFYFYYYNPTLKKIEIGKTIKIKSRRIKLLNKFTM